MRSKLNNKYFRCGLMAFLVIAASICFYDLLFHGSSLIGNIASVVKILMPVIFGFVMAYLLTPALNNIEYYVLIPLFEKFNIKTSKKKSIIRGLSILITACLFLFLIYALIAMLLSQIVPSIQNIIVNFDTYIDNFNKWLDQILADNPNLSKYIIELINKYSVELESWINNTLLPKSSALIMTVSLSVISFFKVVWDFILGFVISIYILASKEKFAAQAKKIAYALFEKNKANLIINNFRFVHKTFIGFISGKILDSFIIGVLCFIGTTILNMPYSVLISVVIGITNIIPFFGPFLGAIPTSILIFVVDPSHPLQCAYFILFILALQQFDGNILGPRILGDSTGLSSFWVIFSITVFGGLFGVLGMVVGVPIFAVVYAGIKSVINAALRKKSMPEETDIYGDIESIESVDKNGMNVFVPTYKKKRKKQQAAEQQFQNDTSDIKTNQNYTESKLEEGKQKISEKQKKE